MSDSRVTHQSVRLGDRFVCQVCKCRWPCLAKATEIKERMRG